MNINIVTPTGDVSEELNLMMISGTLPDLISLGSWEPCSNTLYEQGYTYALNELAAYASIRWRIIHFPFPKGRTRNRSCMMPNSYPR